MIGEKPGIFTQFRRVLIARKIMILVSGKPPLYTETSERKNRRRTNTLSDHPLFLQYKAVFQYEDGRSSLSYTGFSRRDGKEHLCMTKSSAKTGGLVMKKTKRIVASVLCAALLASLAGCGSGNSGGSSTDSTSGSSSSKPASSSSASESKPAENETAEVEAGALPIFAEPTTLRFWFSLGATNMGEMKDYNDADYYQWLEEKTNVHIEWIHPVEGSEQESFNLLFASDEMPDMIENFTSGKLNYQSGPDVAIADEIYLDLTELCDEYAPNYMALINSSEQLKRDSVTDEGNRWCFNYLYKNGRLTNYGPAVRQDFLDAVGKDVPVTYDDWYDVLSAFKNELGIEIPLYYSTGYVDGITANSEFLAGFGAARDFFVDGETVKYGPMEDGYGEYLEMMQKWYAEGLIDQSFAVRTSDTPDDDLILNDKIGALCTFATWAGDKYFPSRGAVNEDFNLVGAPIPVKNEGDKTHIRNIDRLMNTMCIAIAASTKYPTECVRWLDYQYSEEASFVGNYGIREGESYILKDDGTYAWGELITKNPDGLTQNQARTKYTSLNAPFEDYTRVMGSWTQTQLDAQQIWAACGDDGVISSSITMTEDEQNESADIMSDISTYVAEYTVNTIMGNNSVSFDDFRAQLQNMGIERAIELKQEAVTLYNER